MSYEQFLKQKSAVAEQHGFTINPNDLHSSLKPHQRDIVSWALAGGRSAHIADTKSEWLPRVASLCGRWYPRSGTFRAKPAPDRSVCQRCQRLEAKPVVTEYVNPFRTEAAG